MVHLGLVSICAVVSAQDQFVSQQTAWAGDTAAGIPEVIYFDGPGRGKLTRDAFSLGGVEFKDTRISFEDWPKIKYDQKTVPGRMFGHMPVIKRGPYEMAESQATAQYASDVSMTQNKITLTAQQRALDMMLVGTHADCQSAMYACVQGDDAAIARGKAALSGKITPQLEGIERQYKGDAIFLYGTKESGPTLADLAVYNLVESAYPGLKALGFDLAPFAKISATSHAVKVALAAGTRPTATKGPEAAGKPELIYFDGPGRGEMSRLAFALGGVNYTDTRITWEEWPKIKNDPNSIPGRFFGHIPMIRHGDFVVAQSQAVAQYAADISFNSVFQTDEQRGLDAMLLGAHADLQTALYNCMSDDDAANSQCKKDLTAIVTPILEGVERQYRSKGPYIYSLESQGPTLGDLAMLDVVTSTYPGLKALGFDMTPFKKINRMINACYQFPGGYLAAYLQSRFAPSAKAMV